MCLQKRAEYFFENLLFNCKEYFIVLKFTNFKLSLVFSLFISEYNLE